MIATQTSLTMLGLDTNAPQVFWNGRPVPGITSIRVDWEHDDQRVKLRVNGTDDALYAEMIASGINIKRG